MLPSCKTRVLASSSEFRRLLITANYEDYCVLPNLEQSAPLTSTSRRRRINSFQWLKCPAYWSLDPASKCRAVEHGRGSTSGIPVYGALSTEVWGFCTGASVYTGIRKFYEAIDGDDDEYLFSASTGIEGHEFTLNEIPVSSLNWLVIIPPSNRKPKI
ncbi:hypothetical protein DFH07DRAFT_444786 [Mycena maculata]|uniref:Uncharacterized protein n=1 Tax=Mycena maculata TaxID=230809 RepID=A0AAD7J8L8_9AGAR|nr:hypothetical protein DFH07DRAFT_444786 [Mycena maculata]